MTLSPNPIPYPNHFSSGTS